MFSVLLAAWVGCSCGAHRVLPTLSSSQAEAHVSQDHAEHHTKGAQDGDEGQIDHLHVLRRQQEEWWSVVLSGGVLRWRTVGRSWQRYSGAVSRLTRWRGQIKVDGYIVGHNSDLDVVLYSVTCVEAALVLPGLDDQQAIRPGSEARVEIVALHLGTVQRPQRRRQVRTELALQQDVITNPHRAAPLDNTWNIN